eukprot:CAMPEP_0194497990 /NCGR_PEP_ID=MMETSP0253-20130528/14760_1 /TAXON_ID=2966 /ORGANISM="Noctiluca scintillans" /LENGTH=140 /DNA_ID=CAMNT_0039339559 /DNA_START=73 /DNA_END=492 /DNA_ORIENTATION=+
MKAKAKAMEALPLTRKAGIHVAEKLTERAVKRLRVVQGPASYLARLLFTDLQDEVHLSRMDLEQAAQNAHTWAIGSKAGDMLACAANDLWAFDPHPNIHPMDQRLSCTDPSLLGMVPTCAVMGSHSSARKCANRAQGAAF